MNSFAQLTFNLFKYPKFKLEEVFTPSQAASANYIERPIIDRLLFSEMTTPGKQIIVYGHSGSGKTSSVRNLLQKNNYAFIRTHCESNTTFEQLLLNAFDSLNIFVVSSKSKKNNHKLTGSLAAEYQSIKSSIGAECITENNITYSRLLPPQLTPQKLAQFLGKAEIVWVIEDFHKVSCSEKVRIADVIKIFVDNANDYPKSKIICIGACESAHELIQLNPNIKSRVSEIAVPLLNDEEITKLVENGCYLLNVHPCKSLVEKIVYYSDRLGTSAHQMCMDICKGEDILKTEFTKHNIEDKSFQYAIDRFIERASDTYMCLYEAAIKNQLGWYILKTFSCSANASVKLSFEEIQTKVNRGKCRFTEGDIKEKLQELMDPTFNIIYYNQNSEKYALSTPFWHRFLRLQIKSEEMQYQKKRRNNHNPNLKLIETDSRYQIVDESMLKLLRKLKRIDE